MVRKWDERLVRTMKRAPVSHQLGSEAFRTPLCNSLDDEQARYAHQATLLLCSWHPHLADDKGFPRLRGKQGGRVSRALVLVT
jgi:glutamine amidotransferase PdxT